MILSHPAIGRIVIVATFLAATFCPLTTVGAAWGQASRQPAPDEHSPQKQSVDVQETYARAIDLFQNGKNAEALALIDAAIQAGARD